MYNFKNDKYLKERGGKPRLLDISCEHCGNHIAYYQKDGPGLLKRMYQDRFIDNQPNNKELICNSCKTVLGQQIIYKKEDWLAYRLYVGAVSKKIVSRNIIS